MKSAYRYFFILALVSVCNISVASNSVINLKKSSDIKDAMRVHQALEQVSKKVMFCVRHKLAQPTKCFCRYPKAVTRLRNTYNKVIKAHPGWRDNAVNFSNTKGDYGYSVNFFALKTQLEATCH